MQKTPSLTTDCILRIGESVVLIRRKFEPFKGWIALPGGFVEIGEPVEQACVREIKEETGLDINIYDLELVGVYSDASRDPRGHTISVVFQCKKVGNKIKAGDDASSVEIIDNWRELNIAFDHKKILEDAYYLNKKKAN